MVSETTVALSLLEFIGLLIPVIILVLRYIESYADNSGERAKKFADLTVASLVVSAGLLIASVSLNLFTEGYDTASDFFIFVASIGILLGLMAFTYQYEGTSSSPNSSDDSSRWGVNPRDMLSSSASGATSDNGEKSPERAKEPE